MINIKSKNGLYFIYYNKSMIRVEDSIGDAFKFVEIWRRRK